MSDAPSLPPPDASPRRTRATYAGFAGGVVGGIAVGVVAAVALSAAWPSLRGQILPQPRDDSAVLAALDHRLTTLETAAGNAADSSKASLADLQKRLDALELAAKTPPAPPQDPRVAALGAKLDDLSAQIATLKAASAGAADLQPLVARAEAAAQAARDAAAQRQSAEALLVVAGQLRDAVERGSPYASELAAARKVAPPDAAPALDALAVSAESGVRPRRALIASFPAVAAAVTRAALVPDDAEGFWGKLEHKAATLVTVRRTDGHGDDPASIAARAEKALDGNDLAGAVKELSALDGATAAAARDWMAAAQARLSVERALSDLTAKSAAALPKDG
jgi:hypothetical protein